MLRLGLQAWLRDRYPEGRVDTIAEAAALPAALQRARPELLLIEAGLFAQEAIPEALLPRVLVFGAWPAGARQPAGLDACACLGDEIGESALRLAFDCALGCPRQHASRCAVDACELRRSLLPATGLGLSGRELEVFRRLGTGAPPREIAAALGLSVKTVEHYRARIKQKLGLRDSRELLEFAVLWLRGLATRPSPLRAC
ncbi:MAG: helix-turn-helix transcriptional regulator [Xanthomonadales bacterium]|nr:helix-turn-helix transcriptional regulator [Xanthomonadales bacterium]